jgi:hypothetical protein
LNPILTKNELKPAWPLFIVGSPRSGTSVLIDAAYAAGYSGFREGNLLGLLHPLHETVDVYFKRFSTENPKVLMSQVRPGDFHDAILGIFKQTLDSLNPESPWVDKTCNWPTIMELPRIVSLWPESRVIFAKRRGIENVRSRLVKFPARDFTYHCRDWASTMSAWRATRERLDPARYVEIDQFDLLLDPAGVAKRIASLLSLNADAEARVANAFITLRSQETAPGTAQSRGSLDDGHWTKSQVEEFLTLCEAEMRLFGYTSDLTYRNTHPDSDQ